MRALVPALLFLACTAPAPATRPTPPPAQPVEAWRPQKPTLRLPAGVMPVRVVAEATVLPGAPTLESTVHLFVSIERPTDLIWLNATALTFLEARVEAGGRTIAATATAADEHFASLSLAEPVGPGEAELIIRSTAPISTRDYHGAFAGTWNGDSYVYTQFEATSARRVFPCFDEPGFKVPWQLTLTIPRDTAAFSTTFPESEVEQADRRVVKFKKTPPLPSYLIAFAVGPFEVVDAGTAGRDKVPVRIIVPRGRSADAQYAASVTPEIMDRLEAYFGVPYPFEKVDSIAMVPPNVPFAMENPGLITYPQTALLAPAGKDTVARQRGYLNTAVHEIGHQWFGNLVTLAWWDDLWLNEAFASWINDRVVEQWKPEWGGALTWVENRDDALAQDTLAASRAIRQPITSVDDIENAFDGITYGKGQAVLYMFEQYLTPAVFQAGVKHYLEKHAWGNATAGDFFDSLSEAAGRDVSTAMSSFTDRPGAPALKATLSCDRGRPVTVTLEQQRFQPAGASLAPATWKVPVCLSWDRGRQCTLLEDATATVALEGVSTCPAVINPNAGFAGYYRSRGLSPRLFSAPGLSTAERLGVWGDLAAAVVAGEATLANQLELVPVAVATGNRQLIEEALETVARVYARIPPAGLRPLAAFIQKTFGPRARALGVLPRDKDSDDDRLLRARLVELVAIAGQDATLTAQAVAAADRVLADPAAASPETAGLVLGISAHARGPGHVEKVLAALPRVQDPSMRRLLVGSVGKTGRPELAPRVFDEAMKDGNDLREWAAALFALAGERGTREATFELVKGRYDELARKVPREWEARMVMFGSMLCSGRRADEVRDFFRERTTKAPGGPRVYAAAMERMDQCIRFDEAHMPGAEAFLTRSSAPVGAPRGR